jgi:hypothetical protein
MPKKKYGIDMHNFLLSLQLKSFTVTSITRHLLAAYSNEFDKKKNAAQYVYRHLKTLEHEGIITSLSGESGKAIVFSWSKKCDEDTETQNVLRGPSKINQEILFKIKEKIRRYKAEMLTNMGEAEAYSEWVKEMPDFAEDVKSHYQYTRDQTKLMLGKVKAFERLLVEYETRQ